MSGVRRLLATTGLVCVAALPGCGTAPDTGQAARTTAAESGPDPISATPTVAPPATDAPDRAASEVPRRGRHVATAQDAWLGYRVSGGIDGRHEELVVDRDGTARLTVGRPATTVSVQLDPAVLEGLRTALDSARFDADSSEPSGAGEKVGGLPTGAADGLTTTVAHDGRAATWTDGEAPASLDPLVARLQEIVARHRTD